MDTLTQLQQNRRIIQDLTVSTLARISSLYSRLAYLASLRDISTNFYDHSGLDPVYPQAAVRQALEQCHQELFERILETPLVVQEEDLRAPLRTLPNGSRNAAAQWRRLEAYRALLPAESPEYLKELFCSNVRAILEILEKEPSTERAAGGPLPRPARRFPLRPAFSTIRACTGKADGVASLNARPPAETIRSGNLHVFNKIQWTVVLVGPPVFLQSPHRDVY